MEYLNYQFNDNAEFISTFDELPIWSAPFGLLMLKHLELKRCQTVLDIGSGAGFPLMELAERMGHSCKLYGIDPWKNANERARQKIKNYGLTNVALIEASAENLPFSDDSVDLIVSNLGINNFEHPELVFRECNRVLKAGGKLALTSNVNGHWHLFYTVFYDTLKQLGKEHLIKTLKKEEEHRGDVESITASFKASGFKVMRILEENFEMKFLDGTAFLNHHFVKVGWLLSWMGLFPKEELHDIFAALEQNLNTIAAANNGLLLTVPMVFIEGEKI